MSVLTTQTIARKLVNITGRPEIIQIHVRVGQLINPETFADADPLQPISVDPSEIRQTTTTGEIPSEWGRVAGGEWKTKPFRDTSVYISARQRYVEGFEWESTMEWNERVSKIKAGHSTWGCSTESELREKFYTLDDVARSIDEMGYKTQRELSKQPDYKPPTDDTCHPYFNEVSVNIGPNGELIRIGSGRHRLALAQILDVERIPVLVRTRHIEYIKNNVELY